jgi:23S rRNA (guanosine2251-2'-O)-methyltransferase
MDSEWFYGRQAVREILRAGRRKIYKLRLAEGTQESPTVVEILKLGESEKIPVERVSRNAMSQFGDHHQGVAVQAGPLPDISIDDILGSMEKSLKPPLLLLLDQIQDPQNLATLLRTGEAVGIDGVILPMHRSASVTPAVVNASAGATEHLLIGGSNLAQAIQMLKEAGIWIAGLDSAPELKSIFDADLGIPLALVVGSEGDGMRPLTRKSCDFIFRLPMTGKIGSLNAAVAGSVALYLAFQARQKHA